MSQWSVKRCSHTGKGPGVDEAASGILPRYVCLKAQAPKYYDQHHPSLLKLSKVPSTGAHTHTHCEQRIPNPGVHTGLLHLSQQWSPSSGQILWGKWSQRGFCGLLIQWHWYECAYSMCALLYAQLQQSEFSSTTVLCGSAGNPSPHSPCMLPNHFHQTFTQRAGSTGSSLSVCLSFFLPFLPFSLSFSLSFPFKGNIFLFVFNCMWREHYVDHGNQAW